MENFLNELEDLSKQTPYLLQVAEKIKSHNLPVIIFGAAKYAQIVASKLISAGVKISGFAVDEKYFVPGKKFQGYPTFQHDVDEKFYSPDPEFIGLPIYNFEELRKTPDKYIFVLGVGIKSGSDGAKNFVKDEDIIKYNVENVFKVCRIDYDFVFKNKNSFIEAYNLLADDFSKQTMLAYLKAQVTENVFTMKDVAIHNECGEECFNKLTEDIIIRGGTFIDCGAYTGDTIEAFINFVSGNYKKIFAIEADPNNFEKMKDFIRTKNYKNVECINCGVWNEKGSITFKSSGNVSSKIVDTECIGGGGIIVPTDTIDNIVGDSAVDFIKMDIEGAELKALQGAVKTLERCKPILAISAYHKREDLITLPQFINSNYADCKIYLRKHYGFRKLLAMDLYAVPYK